jgi:hypothetical protein
MPKAFIALLLLSTSSATSVDPDAALVRLQKGNARVVRQIRAATPHTTVKVIGMYYDLDTGKVEITP